MSSISPYVELYVDQGCTFNHTLTLFDDLTNTPVNVSGYLVSSQLRRSYFTANASANLICQITDASNGEITISLPPANTSNLKAGRYVFDIVTTDKNLVKAKILEGMIIVNSTVTK